MLNLKTAVLKTVLKILGQRSAVSAESGDISVGINDLFKLGTKFGLTGCFIQNINTVIGVGDELMSVYFCCPAFRKKIPERIVATVSSAEFGMAKTRAKPIKTSFPDVLSDGLTLF